MPGPSDRQDSEADGCPRRPTCRRCDAQPGCARRWLDIHRGSHLRVARRLSRRPLPSKTSRPTQCSTPGHETTSASVQIQRSDGLGTCQVTRPSPRPRHNFATLHLAPCTLHLAPCNLQFELCTLHFCFVPCDL